MYIMLFSHVLVPYDGSQILIKSFDKAIEFARLDPNMKITVLHIVSIPPRTVQMSLYNQYKQSILDEANEIIQPTKDKLADIENPSQALVKEAPSYSSILKFAKEWDCDLIIMGS